uniref:F-box domain-containing protein n=1 Tax=Graphocephala atropunctata TaxID=36148 RepID=A0A1B6M0C4_9HEMI
MDEVGLLSLPEEVIVYMAQFLPRQDLLSCSATCSFLRSVLNDNFIWKRHYRRGVVSYVSLTKPFVKPEFEYLAENESLEPLCEERINLLRQNHLLSNWWEGRCVSHEVHTQGNGLFLENNDRQIIYGNDFLFLHALNTNEICIWNIEETPYLYTSVMFTLYEYNLEDEDWTDIVRVYYQIVSDKLVVIQGNLVQIFGIYLPDKTFPLEYLISVDRDQDVSDFSETLCTDCYNWIVGHLLFSRLCYLPVVHVWDIRTGEKRKALRAPTKGWDLYVISLDDTDDVVFSLRTDDPFAMGPEDYSKISNHISSYNVAKDEFTTIFPCLTGCKPVHAMHYRDFIILFCIDDMLIFKCSIYIVDCRTSSTAAQRSFPDLIGLYKSRVIEDRLVLATQSSVEILTVKNLEVITSIKIDDIIDIDYLPVFSSTFIITSSVKNEIEVWDIDKNQMLLKLPLQSFVFLNEACSKLVMLSGQSLVVKNFW